MSTTPVSHDPSLHDLRIEETVALVSPQELLAEHPLTAELAASVVRNRQAVEAILDREDPRLLVVVGPCSVHDPLAALDYGRRLAALAPELPDLMVVMRVYFEKPRTTTGWKGLINDPHLDDSGDVNTGLRTARHLLLEVLEVGLPIGCEFLDPITPQYIADTVAWGAIGARTTESQTHRQLASGLSMPVGFKNRTDGNVGVAVDAVRAAAAPHSFAAADAPAVDLGDHRFRRPPDAHQLLGGGGRLRGREGEVLAGVPRAVGRDRVVPVLEAAAEVVARTEGPAGTADDDDPDPVVADRGGDGRLDLVGHRRDDRVQMLGPVQGDRRDPRAGRVEDRLPGLSGVPIGVRAHRLFVAAR